MKYFKYQGYTHHEIGGCLALFGHLFIDHKDMIAARQEKNSERSKFLADSFSSLINSWLRTKNFDIYEPSSLLRIPPPYNGRQLRVGLGSTLV